MARIGSSTAERQRKSAICTARSIATCGTLKTEDELRQMVRELAARHRVAIASFCRALCMDWQEIIEHAGDPQITIGAHTANYKMLKYDGRIALRAEMEMSRTVLEAALGKQPNHLAYPVGDPTSGAPREFRIATELGFKTAVNTPRRAVQGASRSPDRAAAHFGL